MKADVKLNKLAKLQLHMLNVRQTTALTVRHYANVILWLKFLPMGLKGLRNTQRIRSHLVEGLSYCNCLGMTDHKLSMQLRSGEMD